VARKSETPEQGISKSSLACDQHCRESTITGTQLKSNLVNRGLANIDKRPVDLQRAQEDGFNKVLKRLSSGNT